LNLAPQLALAIQCQRVVPVVLAGVHSEASQRAQEYLLGVDQERFEAHERFFTSEVPKWLRNQFGISVDRESSGVFGFSNGAAFALTMGIRQRERYGTVIAFSVPRTAKPISGSDYSAPPVPRCYLASGRREVGIRKNTLAIFDTLRKHGVDCVYRERDASHDFDFWAEELPRALDWAFDVDRSGANSK
jgi:enterochelin esterase-like enzyme